MSGSDSVLVRHMFSSRIRPQTALVQQRCDEGRPPSFVRRGGRQCRRGGLSSTSRSSLKRNLRSGSIKSAKAFRPLFRCVTPGLPVVLVDIVEDELLEV